MRRAPAVLTVRSGLPRPRPLSAIPAPVRRDAALAAALCVLVGAASVVNGSAPLEAVVAAAACLPLMWRTRWPLGVLGAVAGISLLSLTLGDPFFPAFVPPVAIALYTVAAQGERRRSVAVAAAVVPCTALVAVVFSPDDGTPARQTLEFASQFGFALAVGEAVRSRRAMVRALRGEAAHAAREHELEAQRRVDEERVRIARDVHDVVAHSLATIATQASVGVHLGAQDPERAVELLRSVKEVSTGALLDLRSALRTVRDDAPTRPAPSLGELPELVDRARSSGLSVVLRTEGSPAGMPAAVQVAVYRIVQEGLTNVMRHAGGAETLVRVAVDGHEVEVDVRNDGAGKPTSTGDSGSGSGLIGMRERASALGGAFTAQAQSDGGFRVHAVLPLEAQPA